MKVTIIIPCYNEELNIPFLIKKCAKVYNQNNNIKFILVNNGSTDGSKNVLNLNKKSFIKIINLRKNNGYGNGIIAGIREAEGDIIGWTHADLQTDIEDILVATKIFKKNKLFFVKGNRFGRNFMDKILTLLMSIFETILFKKVMYDINAQPTLFNKKLIREINFFPKDFTIDLYIYYIALVKSYEIKRFPVKFSRRKFGISSWNRSIYMAINQIFIFIKQSIVLKKNIKKVL